jgi:hypothetical protein
MKLAELLSSMFVSLFVFQFFFFYFLQPPSRKKRYKFPCGANKLTTFTLIDEAIFTHFCLPRKMSLYLFIVFFRHFFPVRESRLSSVMLTLCFILDANKTNAVFWFRHPGHGDDFERHENGHFSCRRFRASGCCRF